MRALRRRSGLLLIALLLPGVSGCAGHAVRLAELPEVPLAVVHRPPEMARRRAELLADREARRAEAEAELRRRARGVFDLDRVAELFGRGQPPDLRRLQGRVVLLHPRTGELEDLPALLPGDLPLDWSADHRRLLFASVRRGNPQLFELDRASGEIRRLTRGPDHPWGRYGPAGRLVLVEGGEGGEGAKLRVGVTGPGGGRARLLTPGPSDWAPVFAPDGRQIVYVGALSGGGSGILSVRLEGERASPPRVLARGGMDPTFTPDGEWIVYAAQTPRGFRIFRMRPDGTGKIAVGRGLHDERRPAVSPDGAYVAFVSMEAGRERLLVRRLDGSGEGRLLDDGDGAFPVW